MNDFFIFECDLEKVPIRAVFARNALSSETVSIRAKRIEFLDHPRKKTFADLAVFAEKILLVSCIRYELEQNGQILGITQQGN